MKVYLAGPDVFLPDAIEIGRRGQALCARYGLTGLYPLDSAIALDNDDASLQIFHANQAMMIEATRDHRQPHPVCGPSADAGTVYEFGFMAGRGKLCLGYSNDPAPYPHRVAARGHVEHREGALFDANGHLIEDFGLADNLMMMHALDLHGCALLTPRQTPSDLWRNLAAFEACVSWRRADCCSGLRNRNGQTRCRTSPPDRKRADVALVERGLFESRARAQAGSRPAWCSPTAERDQGSSEPIAPDAVIEAGTGASLRLARRRETCRGARALSDRDRKPCLPRRRRLHWRVHRSAARRRRPPGVCRRCRPRPIASLTARSSKDRLDGADRHPRSRRPAAAGPARRGGDRRQLHLAANRAAGGDGARRRADEVCWR